MVVESSFDKDSDKIFYDLDKATKKRGNCLTCRNFFIALVFLLLTFVALIVWGISLTGIVKIPLFYELAYPNNPSPIREVKPSESKNSDLLDLKISLTNQPAQVIINETDLTKLIRTPSDKGEVSIKQGQIAINTDMAEIYGRINITKNRTAVIKLILKETANDVTFNALTIGYLPIPKSVAQNLISTFVGKNFISLKSAFQDLFDNNEFGKDLIINSVQLDQGKVTLDIKHK